MTIREDLQAFLAEKPFNNPLTPEELYALAAWINRTMARLILAECITTVPRNDLAAKLRRLEEAGFTLENSDDLTMDGKPYIEDPYGRWSMAVLAIGDLPEAIDAAIAEMERRKE